MIRSTLIISLCVFLIGCSEPTGHSEITWHDQRTYHLRISTLDELPVLNVEVDYLGKHLGDDSPKQTNTDYYHVRFTNISDDFVHFERIDYDMEIGQLKSARTKFTEGIDQIYGQHSLAPGETLSRSNARVWAYADNMLHRVFTLKVGGQSIRADIPLVYRQH